MALCGKLSHDKEQAKKLSKRIYKSAMTALSDKTTDELSTPRG